ncbi:hypothetical protein [Nonomuraea sp. KM90]|uniref:hypothetical protein n=1 Tax=Nonomuraea sp. KM90 TaxID=3457428 RepID=UPI003FCD21B2
MRNEDDLVRTLRAAAGQARPLDLAGGVARRRRARRTRQRVRVLLAAAAVVAVVGGTAAVLSGEERRAEPAVTVTPSAPVTIESVTDLWPRAILKMPARDSKGRRMYPVIGLGPTEVLLAANSAFERAGRLEVYDSATGRRRVLGEIPSGGKRYYPQLFAANAGYIAWYGETVRDPAGLTDFWIMPRAGGEAERVAEVKADVDAIGLTGDSLVWSLRKGGVHRVPLSGGTPERLAGTDGLHLTSWPWAVARAGDEPGANVTRVVNLETGRSQDVAIPEGASMTQCNAQWCAAIQRGRLVVQRLDGSGRRTLPAMFRPFGARWLLGDRYALFNVYSQERSPISVVYDLATGATAGIHEKPAGARGGFVAMGASSSAPPTTVYWDADQQYSEQCERGACRGVARGGGKEYTVLNLAAITE